MNANKTLASLCVPVSYNDKCEGCESKNHYLLGARVHARARNLDFIFVKVDEKVMGTIFVTLVYLARIYKKLLRAFKIEVCRVYSHILVIWNSTALSRADTFGAGRVKGLWNVASVSFTMLFLHPNWYGELNTHHRRTMVTTTNIECIEEVKRKCFTSMYLQHDTYRCKRRIGTPYMSQAQI